MSKQINPYQQGTKDYADWQHGYDQEPWTAPANNASAAQWHGYHAAAKNQGA